MDRRAFVAATIASAAAGAAPSLARTVSPAFPSGFLWGASTAPHQIEGNNVASDLWFVENQQPTVFAEPSGDAANSLELWQRDLDLAREIGLNTYRFGIEWARIEPERNAFSQAMIDHYARVIEGCLARQLTPVVTFSHFSAPRWFSAQGGWMHQDASDLFARYAERITRALGDRIARVITFNEPNILDILLRILPPQVWDLQKATLDAAAKRLSVPDFVCANIAAKEDVPLVGAGLLKAHSAGRSAIKAARAGLPVGLSLSMFDDQAVGRGSVRDTVRAELYGKWLEVARSDDFLGVQNYERVIWNDKGRVASAPGGDRNWSGTEVWAPSLAGAVRYAFAQARVPILVSEHGVGTDDDALRARFIPAALSELKRAIDDGIPVIGYCHWSLIDNFEWIFGNKPKFGLASVDHSTFARHPKPSAAVLGSIAKRNAL